MHQACSICYLIVLGLVILVILLNLNLEEEFASLLHAQLYCGRA